MLERKVILAVGAHQDDAEFYMSSPLFLLGDDWEKHIATFANGSCGTSIPGIPRIVGIRTTEAENAAKLAKAEFHCGEYPDVGFVVDNDTLAAATALIRKIRPSIVITHHWEDYMLDHTATSELIREGCFRRGLVNYTTRPQLPPYADNESYKADICLYYAQPHLNRRNNGEFVEPGMFIDVSDKMREIIKMLRKHESQYDWLKDTQGGNYVITLLKNTRELGILSGAFEYAQGLTQHLHAGLGGDYPPKNPLTQYLGDKVKINQRFYDNLLPPELKGVKIDIDKNLLRGEG